ncbi:MFS transporter [Jannaschia pohangensis]|uniref:Predicted arabinose efflux permease, MFS family n=1 Tax=Jannaschia pohangensis TaxID=390807 RepID=A0A1I3I3S8_9RHOB|nr:MFS transporter [Jannaschia pohangensis]SFI42487.1 Predicted arabinose efflux permease, MFS family [Jannaschia pohangensis]
MERTRPGLVALIFVAGLFAAAQFGKITLTLPEVGVAFDRQVPQVAFMVSLVGLVGLVFGAMAGALAAGFGLARTFLAGLILGAAMSGIQALMPPLWLFAATRVVEGVAHLCLVVAGPPLMAAAASERDRPLVMGLWAVFFGASLALSGWLFPFVLAQGGLPLLFALHGLGLLILAAVLWRRLPRSVPHAVVLEPVAMHRAIYGRLSYVAPGLGFFCYTFLFIALIATVPNMLGRPGLATVLPLVTLATTLAGGAVCRWFAPWKVAAAGYLGTLLGLLGTAFGLPGAVEVGFAAMGLIPGASFAAIPALNILPGDRARATGAIAQLGNLGTVTGTPVLAFAATGGLGVLMTVAGAAALLGGVLSVWTGLRLARGHR